MFSFSLIFQYSFRFPHFAILSLIRLHHSLKDKGSKLRGIINNHHLSDLQYYLSKQNTTLNAQNWDHQVEIYWKRHLRPQRIHVQFSCMLDLLSVFFPYVHKANKSSIYMPILAQQQVTWNLKYILKKPTLKQMLHFFGV